MIVIPAIDLREGACVQLVGGSYQEEKIRLENPLDVARGWANAGFQRVHVVDLDAATGRGSNESVVRDLLAEQLLTVQVGGGIRDTDTIERLLGEGASYVVAGTRAIEDPHWLEDVARTFPGSVIVAADVRGRKIVTRGWARTTQTDIVRAVEEFSRLDLAAVLVTAVHVEGQMLGPDLSLMEDVVEASALPVLASGGISSLADLRELEERGISGAIIGMALYTGTLDPQMAAMEFSE
jgi:phosphoribosylformimino-5-aminoimidazole carboxamide ribotide isomerase